MNYDDILREQNTADGIRNCVEKNITEKKKRRRYEKFAEKVLSRLYEINLAEPVVLVTTLLAYISAIN